MFSKHAWAVPLKTKNENEMATAIAKIIRDGFDIWKQFTHNENYKWIDLPRLVSEYNA